MRKLLLAAGLVLLSTAAAHSQQIKFCDGILVVNSASSTVHPDGDEKSSVEYHVVLQNLDMGRRTINAALAGAPGTLAGFPVDQAAQPADIGPYQVKDITLFTLHLPNPTGKGAPSARDVAHQVSFTCTLH